VAAALEEFVQGLGIGGTLRRYDVLTLWREIVGEQVAKAARPERIEKGVLLVRVETAPWRAELSLRKAEIMKRIAAVVGNGVVNDIRFH